MKGKKRTRKICTISLSFIKKKKKMYYEKWPSKNTCKIPKWIFLKKKKYGKDYFQKSKEKYHMKMFNDWLIY